MVRPRCKARIKCGNENLWHGWRVRVYRAERMFMLERGSRASSDSRNVHEDLGYTAPWGEVACYACEATDPAAKNVGGKVRTNFHPPDLLLPLEI